MLLDYLAIALEEAFMSILGKLPHERAVEVEEEKLAAEQEGCSTCRLFLNGCELCAEVNPRARHEDDS